MANKNILEVEGGQITTLGALHAFETDDGTTSNYILWTDLLALANAGNTVVQRVEATPNVTHSSITTALPVDDTIPQSGEGGEVITVTITPTSATNRLVIRGKFMGTSNTALLTVVALFQDATAGALAVAYQISTADGPMSADLVYEMAAGTTSATTFKLRAGNNTGATTYVNGTSAGRRFGGVSACRLSVEEIKV